MKPTSDDARPRRDGWFQHKGVWSEVTVGTVLEGPKAADRWEVVAVSHGQQIQLGYTLWFRVREQTRGVEFTIEPQLKVNPVTILTQDPRDQRTAAPTPPEDLQAIRLVIEELDAVHLATIDSTTGEVTCPDYIYRSHIPGYGAQQQSRGLREHLRTAHGMEIADEATHDEMHAVHSQAHNPKWPNIGKGGFPHRHVPEDLSQF